MHEMALSIDIVDNVISAAENAQANQVKSIILSVGDGRDIVPDLFCGAIKYLTRGTIAENAEVLLNTVPYLLRCNNCGQIYNANLVHTDWSCPNCRNIDFEIHSGMEFQIDSIEIV